MQQNTKRPHVVLFYFSGTGNTWWVTGALAEALTEEGFQVQVQNIEMISDTQAGLLAAQADLVGAGYPIYGSDLPEPMKAFLSGLPQGGGKPALVYCTQYLWSGDGARVGADLLTGRGYQIRWSAHFRMPSNITVNSLVPGMSDSDPKTLRMFRDRADRRIRRWARAVAGGRRMVTGMHPLARFAGSWQRVPYRRGFSGMQALIGADPALCTRCGRCIRLCPVGNLVMTPDGIRGLGRCVLCVRCYNFCPAAAMTYRGRTHNHRRGPLYPGPVEGFCPERDLLGRTDCSW